MARVKKTKIAINGFGRIGRSILRALLTSRQDAPIEITAINDIASLKSCAYLFEYDSIFGPFKGAVDQDGQHLIINGQAIPFTQERDISNLDLSDVDVLLECTGAAGGRGGGQRALASGAARVLISGPADGVDDTIVLGANEGILANQKIVSNASCTTNALAPLLLQIDQKWGVESGHMTTVHCYTGSQPMIDRPHDDLARSRAGALSMVPTTTSAGRLIGEVLPHLSGKIEARAIRVPTASVSAIDLTVQTSRAADVDEVNAHFRTLAQGIPIFGWIDAPLVSTDLRGRPESIIISGLETSLSQSGLLRVFGWYDNEWGFSNRMIDMALLMGR